MVFELQFRRWHRHTALSTALISIGLSVSMSLCVSGSAQAAQQSGKQLLSEAHTLYRQGQYFKAARYAFAAQERDRRLEPQAYSLATLGLVSAGLPQTSSYFYIRTLQTGNRTAIRQVLKHTQELMIRVGGDLFRKYLLRHTQLDDYDSSNRSAYLYVLARDALQKLETNKVISYVSGMSNQSPLWPFALQMRGTALAMQGQLDAALTDFEYCEDEADRYAGARVSYRLEAEERSRLNKEARDLKSRCVAGQARTLYEKGDFEKADRFYDRIPKASFVWTDTLFEQAWNAFALGQYNRTLGRLVSYKSPALEFVFNSEVDVLRAQSYLLMCLYTDANDTINEFNQKYGSVGQEVKRFVERNPRNLSVYYKLGKDALKAPLHNKNSFYRMVNRFVRAPYFQNQVAAEQQLSIERRAIRHFNSMQKGVSQNPSKGFPGFLDQVLGWRAKSIHLLGGAFVKNSIMDYHSVLISDFEKIAFIKLEMLSRAKDKLLKRASTQNDRSRGSVEPVRRDDQFYWSFNGEFWNDELGDYVFGLESECNKS